VRQTQQDSKFRISRKHIMASINEQHASHIGTVQVSFFLSALDLNPDAISEVTGLNPDKTAKRGDDRRNYKGGQISPHQEGFWMISSEGKVESKDINDHIDFLLALLLPHRATLSQIVWQLKGETFFDVLWTSNYLYAGTGPIISYKSLQGMSDLGASIGFDIYQDEVDLTDSE
jgi:hypothetical protein